MKRLRLSAVACALVMAAMPSRADAASLSLTGDLGLVLSRSDGGADGIYAGSTVLDWWGQLSLAGSPFRPGLLDFVLTGYYHGTAGYYPGSRDRTDNIGGRGQISLFNGSPLSLTLGASRDWTSFTGSGDNTRTGSMTTNSVAGTALLSMRGYPTVRASVMWNDLTNRTLDGADSKEDTFSASAGIAHNIGRLTYALSYDLARSYGTFDETNYYSHSVNLQLTAPFSENATFRLIGRYFLRQPTNDSPTNPRFDDASLGAGVQWHPGKATASFDYSYRHFLIESHGAADLEEESHGFTETTTYRKSEELTLNAGGNVYYVSERHGDGRVTSAAEALSGGLSWRHKLNRNLVAGLGLGIQGGLLEGDPGGTALSYGVNASAGLNYDRRNYNLALNYGGSYLDGVGGEPGWSLRQQLLLTGEGVVKARAILRGTIALVGARREDPLLGSFEAGSATLTFDAIMSRYRFQLTGGATGGASPALGSDSLLGDGLFLPVGFNTYSLFAALTAGQTADRGRLVLTETLRTLWTRGPGRPDQYEDGLDLSFSYNIGAFILSLDEHFSYGGIGASRRFGNLVMARISRSFGWKFF